MGGKYLFAEGQRFYPTSPLKDYGSSEWAGGRRRSRSATVRFRSPRLAGDDVSVRSPSDALS